MDAETFSELLTAYALDALSEEERVAVEAYLATSPEAQAELRTYEAMLTGLALLTPHHEAPAHLTDDFRRMLAEQAGSPPGLPAQTAAPVRAPDPVPIPPVSAPVNAPLPMVTW